MCRAVKVLCAAPPDRLAELKRATVSAAWELVGGATSVEELLDQAATWRPDVVVVDPALGADACLRVREILDAARVVSLGASEGADLAAPSLDAVRDAVLGLPPPGGPVRL